MSLLAKDEAPDRENPKTGLAHAICCMVRDAGVDDFQGDGKWKPKVWIAFELAQVMEDGRPFMLSSFYTLSLNEKANLRRDLEGLLGRPLTTEELDEGYDLESLVGQHLTINVVLKDTTKGQIGSIGSLAPAMDGQGDLSIVNTDPPDWVVKRIVANMANKSGKAKAGDGIPF